VLDIARQLSAGLAAAHVQGVLHRDLKPGNVLIDEHGQIRITDFGIAVSLSDQGHDLIGTPAYMAPEQLTPGATLSERTDLYALGLMLYELLVGVHPFGDSSRQRTEVPRPSLVVPGVSTDLDAVIVRLLALDPQRRPASAAAVAERLVQAHAPMPSRVRPAWLWGAGAVLAIVALVAALMTFANRADRPLTETDTLVLADFTNTTGEPVFDGALKVAFAVALEQSPFLKIYPDERVRDTLRLMERQPDERITRALARDIARRDQLKALVAGSIGRFGSHYVITVEVINAESGDVMAREQVEAPSREDVLRLLGESTARLRQRLGESLASVQRFDTPLPRATTASLDALHAYALGLDQGRATVSRDAIPHLKRAIELDPSFAMAYAQLSGVYANTGQFSDAPTLSRRAFELRDRVSERERFFISWRYYVDAEQAWDKALDLATSWTATYPREAFAFNSLGLASGALGRREQAVDAYRHAKELDPAFRPPYGNLIGSLIVLNRSNEAKSLLSDASMRGIDGASLRRSAFTLALLADDAAGMARELEATRKGQFAIWAPTLEARASVAGGRLEAARALYQRAAQDALSQQLPDLAAQWLMEGAEAHAAVGLCDDAQHEVTEGLAVGRDNFTLERAGRTLALCGAATEVGRLSDELARRYPAATLTSRVQRPVMQASLALRRGDAANALELLGTVEPFDNVPASELWPAYLRGQAYLQQRNAEMARTSFQDVVERRAQSPTAPAYALSWLGLARAEVMRGDTAAARAAYERFFGLWQNADPTLVPLVDARREYARLG
jgi:tetratricopeptide (TPR) repeat protein